MSEVLPGSPQLTLFAEGSLARTYHSPELVPGWRAPGVVSGTSSRESSLRSDPDGSLSKTSQVFSRQPMPNMTDAAYAAGLVDGEGCLLLTPQWQPALYVGMSVKARALLDQMAQRWGGTVRAKQKATAKWEAACMWEVIGYPLEPLLNAIAPFMRLKAEHARLLQLAYQIKAECPHRSNGRAVLTDDAKRRLTTIRATITGLNRKGPQTPTAPMGFAQLVGGQWMTSQRDFFSETGLAPYCETWPRSGMTRNGTAYQRQPSAPLTDATASGSWPTPRANERQQQNSQDDYVALSKAVTMWPTPKTARPMSREGAIKEYNRRGHDNSDLRVAVHTWPTPRAEYDSGRHRGKPDTLHSAVKAWPTPTARDYRSPGTPERLARLPRRPR